MGPPTNQCQGTDLPLSLTTYVSLTTQADPV